MKNNKEIIKREINDIFATVDIEHLNKQIGLDKKIENTDFKITNKTLRNIGEWALDGKSMFEIAHNLELNELEMEYLIKVCPAILLVMQHTTAYADIVVAGTLFQTAIGGKVIKKKIPLKVRDFDGDGKVIGEHYEMVEVEETTEPNPYLLKYLTEHKMSEKFSNKIKSSSEEHRDVIENMTEEERKMIEDLGK